MGNDREPKEIPADKLAENLPPQRESARMKTLREFNEAVVENFDEVSEEREKNEREQNRKLWNWYRKTLPGKLWVKLRNRLKKSSVGRIGLAGIYLGMFIILIASPSLAGVGLD